MGSLGFPVRESAYFRSNRKYKRQTNKANRQKSDKEIRQLAEEICRAEMSPGILETIQLGIGIRRLQILKSIRDTAD